MDMNIDAKFAKYASEYDRSVRVFIFVVFMLFLLLILLSGGNSTLQDPDTYWHIAVGRAIWQSGTLPRVDEMSHTFQGHPWIANDWLVELLMYGAYSLGGWRTVVLLTNCALAGTFALLYFVLSRELRLSVAVGTATVAYVFSAAHFLARPHVFAFPLIIVWFAGLVRATERKTLPSLWLLPVMAVWANIHGSFTLGLAFAGAVAAEAVFSCEAGDRVRTGVRWGFFLAAALAAACATPYGYEPVLLTFMVFHGNAALQVTSEWLPMFVHRNPINPALTFVLLFLALYYGVKIPFWRLLQVIALAYGMLSHIRLAPLFAIIAPILLMGPLARQFPFLRLSTDIETNPDIFAILSKWSRTLLYPATSLLIIAIIGFGLFGPSLSPKSDITPAGAVDYMAKHHLDGKIYNAFNFGGYLIFRGIKTFIDGRTDQLFSGGFMEHLNEISKEPSDFIPLLDKYGVSLALVTPQSIEAHALAKSTLWRMVYSDEISSLYAKNGQ